MRVGNKKPSPKALIYIGLGLLLLIGVGLLAAYYAVDKPIPVIGSNKYPNTKRASGYNDGSFLYNCSREIELKYTGRDEPGSLGVDTDPVGIESGPLYEPVNKSEAKLYCRTSGVIEYHAILDVLELPATQDTIKKYGNDNVLVQALRAKYIYDTDYIHRILPDYASMQIHCIIAVTTPNEKLYFLENGADHQYIQVPQDQFEASLAKASESDRNDFINNLH